MRLHEEVVVKRDVEAVVIPAGNRVLIPEGITVTITQALGGSFTVVSPHGYMARIAGADADALGKEPPEVQGGPETEETEKSGSTEAKANPEGLERQVWDQLKMVYDPEIPVNIVDLGLIYGCEFIPKGDGFRVELKMTMTAPGCGMGDVLKAEAEERVLSIPQVVEAEAEIVWDPPWDQSRMSEAARLELGFG